MNAQREYQDLLEPITGESPCGENLEDTSLLAAFDAFRVFGQATPLDPQPEWPEVKAKALEALRKSKDLRLLAYLGSAVLRTDGIAAFSGTLSIADRWLGTYWSQVFPLVDEDVIERRNALNCFADPMAVIDGLRRVPLISSRAHGTFSLRDIDIAAGLLTPRDGESRPDPAQIDAAFAAGSRDDLTALHTSIVDAVSALKGIDARLREAAGSEASPTFDPLSTQLTKMERVLAAHIGTGPGADGGVAEDAGEADGSVRGGVVGAIQSRQDAIRALDAVAEFFRRTEPSSPIPMFLTRAKRLVSKDFLEVLADVAPDAVAQARAAGGVRDDE